MRDAEFKTLDPITDLKHPRRRSPPPVTPGCTLTMASTAGKPSDFYSYSTFEAGRVLGRDLKSNSCGSSTERKDEIVKSRIKHVIFIVLMAVFLCGCGNSLVNIEKESQAIWDVRLAVQKALCTEDTDAMMQLWAEQGTFGQPDGSLWIGKDKIREAHDKLFEMFDDFKIEFKRLTINFPIPDVAVEEASYDFRATGFHTKGRDTTVLVKQDSRWLIAAVSDFFPQTPAKGTVEQAEVNNQEDINAIRKLFNDFCEAHKYGDGADLAEFYTDDAVLMPSDEPIVTGKAAIASRYQQDLERFTVELVANSDEIDVSGNLGFARGTFMIKLTPKAQGEKIEITFKAISILRKGPDGSWKLYCDIWNSDAPLPPNPEDLIQT